MYVLDNPSGGALPSPPSSPLGGTGKPVEVRRGPATVAGVKAPAAVAASAHLAEGRWQARGAAASPCPGSQETSLRVERRPR